MAEFHFSPREREIVLRLGEAAVPAAGRLPPFGPANVDRLERYLSEATPPIRRGMMAVYWMVEESAYARYLKPFSRLAPAQAAKMMQNWAQANIAARTPFRLALGLVKTAYYDNPEVCQLLGVDYQKPPAVDEPARWLSQVMRGADLGADQTIEAEVVVIGTGAGGAAAAAELAERGNAVLLLEEGELHRRSEFTGRPLPMQRLMYRNFGLTATIGNATVLVPLGRAVGGTTVINSGTCFRTPRRELRRWREELGLVEFTPGRLEPYFRKVEAAYRATVAEAKQIGPIGEIIARGADRLGWSHGPLTRNAPDCDGQGVCCYGCPTDAKRSTNLSFIPAALAAGAQLATGVVAENLLFEKGVVAGVEARSLATGRRLLARAPIVVLACGALHTPLLLAKHKLGARSGQLGRNLAIHPAGGVVAMMNEKVEGWKHIPQGYMVDEFAADGIMLEGAFLPLDSAAMTFPQVGAEVQEILGAYERMAMFGYMIRDDSRGVVRRRLDGQPLALYYLNEADRRRLVTAQERLSRLFLEAGASVVFSGVHGWRPMRALADLEANRKIKPRVWDIDLSAYHPHGTCHMGADPKRAVTNGFGELHDVKNLFVCDASVVPPALGVNPQITISALAVRTAEHISDRLKTMISG